jgi:hypothetical protein
MYQNQWRDKKSMCDVAIVRECAAPISPGEGVNSQIRRASNRLKWAYWRTFNAWYGKIQLSAEEREQARAVMIRNTRNQEAVRDEFNRGLQIVIGAAERFAAVDPEFFRPQLNALRELGRDPGDGDLA